LSAPATAFHVVTLGRQYRLPQPETAGIMTAQSRGYS
jgi:hypothetical protein